MKVNVGSKLLGCKLTSPSPEVYRRPSPVLAKLSGELIPDHLLARNVHPPIGTGRPSWKKRPQDRWPGYLERHKKNEPKKKGKETRMRGGAGVEYGASLFPDKGDFTWYNSRFATNGQQRLEGGGCFSGEARPQMPSYQCSGPPLDPMGFLPMNNDSLMVGPQAVSNNRCHPTRNKNPDASFPSPPKENLEGALKNRALNFCSKKQCEGSDCLIKAFKDAQEFVDGLGKVPGLAGLGIVQGPYFKPLKEAKNVESVCQSFTRQQAPPPSEPQAVDNSKKSSPPNAPPPTPNSVRKSYIVQEGPVTFPDPATRASLKAKKKESEKSPQEAESPAPAEQPTEEGGPCGSPKCKSRPKKKVVKEVVEPVETVEKPEEKNEFKSDNRHSKSKHGHKGSKSSPGLKSKHKTQWEYNFGNLPPASVHGHKDCKAKRPRVPAKQGWFWNKDDAIAKSKWYKPRPGWRPGAISTVIRDILTEAKEGFFKQSMSRPRSAPAKGKKAGMIGMIGAKKHGKDAKQQEEEPYEEIEHPPTLHVHRKSGDYYLTMYPVRPETKDLQRLDDQVSPIQLKIPKRQASVASSSTASDIEIQLSPPAAVNRPRRKPDVVHVETQLREQMISEEYKSLYGTSNKKKNGKELKKDKKKK